MKRADEADSQEAQPSTMRTKIYFVGSAFGTLITTALLVVGFIAYQQKYVCEPKVAEAISQFANAVVVSEYESLRNSVNFPNEQEFLMFKDLISKKYSWEIRKWKGDMGAVSIFKFESGPPYAVTLVMKDTYLPICWGQRYTVLTVAR